MSVSGVVHLFKYHSDVFYCELRSDSRSFAINVAATIAIFLIGSLARENYTALSGAGVVIIVSDNYSEGSIYR